MEELEHRYEFSPSDMDEFIFYLMNQSKAFQNIAKIIGYKYPEYSFLMEVCDRLADVCSNLGRYVKSKK